MPCACSTEKTTLLYACSGAADTGLLADRVVRKLRADKKGAMTCLAAIGAKLSAYGESAKSADDRIVIDGCPVACGKKQMEALGLTCRHAVLTDLGVEKGKTAVTDALVDEMAEKVIARLGL